MRMIIGEVVKRLRLKYGLTQDEVCKQANLTQGFYSAIENGATPSLETLIRLSQVFDLPVFFIVWMATEKREISKRHRAWYSTLKPVLDNIIEQSTTNQ